MRMCVCMLCAVIMSYMIKESRSVKALLTTQKALGIGRFLNACSQPYTYAHRRVCMVLKRVMHLRPNIAHASSLAIYEDGWACQDI